MCGRSGACTANVGHWQCHIRPKGSGNPFRRRSPLFLWYITISLMKAPHFSYQITDTSDTNCLEEVKQAWHGSFKKKKKLRQKTLSPSIQRGITSKLTDKKGSDGVNKAADPLQMQHGECLANKQIMTNSSRLKGSILLSISTSRRHTYISHTKYLKNYPTNVEFPHRLLLLDTWLSGGTVEQADQ